MRLLLGPNLQVLPIIADPTSHQLPIHRGPAAEGVALKIRRTPCRRAAGRDGITTERKLQTGFRGLTLCRRPLPGSSTGELVNCRKIGHQRSARSRQNCFLLEPQRALKTVKNVNKTAFILKLPRTPSENSVEIHRSGSGQYGSFIFTFATNLEIAFKWLPTNLLLGSL